MYRRVGFCSEVPDNAGADKKIALATIARRYIQLRQSRPAPGKTSTPTTCVHSLQLRVLGFG